MTINKDLIAIASGSGTAIYQVKESVTTVFGTSTEFWHLITYGIIGGAAGYIGKLLIDLIIFYIKQNKS